MGFARCGALVRGIALLLAVTGLSRAAGQAPENFPYLAALTADVVVRAGADIRYYPFGRVETGDVVKIVGRKAGWAQVATVGPAFKDFFGYVKYPRTSNPRIKLSPDSKTAMTGGPTDLFAPNLDAKFEPGSSWKPVMTMPADRKLQVVATTREGDDVVHKVILPADAVGWIDVNHLRAATAAESAMWEASVDEQPQPAREQLKDIVVRIEQEALSRAKMNEGAAIEAPAVVQTDPVAVVDTPLPPAPAAPRPRTPQRRLAQIMLDDLEAAYTRLRNEPIETAEVNPLRLLYLDLAKRHQESRSIVRYAQTRARQLELWAEVQVRRGQMTALQARGHQTSEQAEAARLLLEASERYEAVGQLDASTIYDGKRLPRLLCLRDPVTGRTIGYLEPNDQFDFVSLLGRQVGVVGDRAYDGGLRVSLITPRRIDVLDETD